MSAARCTGLGIRADACQEDKMKRSLSQHGIARAVAATVGLAGLAACSQVAAVHHPIQYVAERSPQRVWVVRRHNDSVFTVQSPRLQGDTLVGFTLPTAVSLTQYVEIPGTDIKQLRARERSPVRTGALAAGTIGLAVFTWTQLVHGSSGQRVTPLNDPNCDCDFDSICGC
jgi:hypothetical protein